MKRRGEALKLVGPIFVVLVAMGAIMTIGIDSVAEESAGGQEVGGLRLRLVVAKTGYAQREPLQARAFLDNVSDTPMVVLTRATHTDLGLDGRTSAGEWITSLLPPGPPRPPTKQHLSTIAPGASLELRDWELLGRINRQIELGNGRQGDFSLLARYRADSSLTRLDPAVWTGELESNRVSVSYR